MSTHSPNVSEVGPSSISDEIEIINLRPIVNIYIRWWREILLFTIALTVIGGGIALYRQEQEPERYEATAQVAITRISSKVVLDSTIQTKIDNDVSNQLDSLARRNSLIGLVNSGTIATEVINELGPLLGDITPAALLRKLIPSSEGKNATDLISITIMDTTPEDAAIIANSWAKHYVNHVNVLYSELPMEMAELVSVEVTKSKEKYETTQQAFEELIRQNDLETLLRQVDEKEQLIATLQSTGQLALQSAISQTVAYRSNLITTYQDALQANQLLALTSDQAANRSLVKSLIQTISANRQLALDTEQGARVKLFTQYAERELDNRLLAIQQEQNAKTQIFQAYSTADLQAKLAVFNQQADRKVGELLDLYATQRRVEQLLGEAQALQIQIAQAGEAGANSNGLPLLLLKLQAYDAADNGDGITSLLQVNLAGDSNLETDVSNQAADVAALIDTLTARAANLHEQIDQQSLVLFNNEGYALLNGERPEDDALYAAIQEQYLALFDVDELAVMGDTMGDDTVLSQAILAKYDELFGVGTLATASLTISNTMPIYVALQEQYPSLFSIGDLTQLGDILAGDSALDSAGQQKLLELLQPMTDLDVYLNAIDVNTQPILKLEEELRGLYADIEHKRAQSAQLVKERDIALESYTTLNSKLLELSLERTIKGREVGLASLATPPDKPIQNENLATTVAIWAVLSFFLASLIAILASVMDVEPFLSRFRPAPVRPANQVAH